MAGYIGKSQGVTQVDGYNRTEADDRYVNASGDTMTGALALPAGGLTVGTDQLAVDASGRVTMPYQPAFLAYSQGTFSATSGIATGFATIQHNIGNYYNNTNGTFTAPVSGTYMFWANSRTSDGLSARNESTRFVVNGANQAWTEIWSGETYDASAPRAGQVNIVTIYLAANDTVQINVSLSQFIHLSFGGY